MFDARESCWGRIRDRGGVYVVWNFETQAPLYVGIASDFPVRFAQHNGLRSCPARSCKREQIAAYFDGGDERLGYLILPVSSLSQPDAARHREYLGLESREAIELHEALTQEAIAEIRAMEGALIAAHKARFGGLPPWNVSPGPIPRLDVAPDDGALAVACGYIDCLLQSRRTIRGLAADHEATMFERHLHGLRLLVVREATMNGMGLRNDMLRRRLEQWWAVPAIRDLILDSGYLNDRNPLTVGPIAEPPDDASEPPG